MTPPPLETDYPTFLDLPASGLMVYLRETVVAEKLDTMLQRGLTKQQPDEPINFRQCMTRVHLRHSRAGRNLPTTSNCAKARSVIACFRR